MMAVTFTVLIAAFGLFPASLQTFPSLQSTLQPIAVFVAFLFVASAAAPTAATSVQAGFAA
jgi:hypothetical protein